MSSIHTLIFVLSAYIPDLLGIVIGLTMVLGLARPGPERTLAVVGLSLLLTSTLLRLGLTFAQNAMLARAGSTGDLSHTLLMFTGVHVLLNLLGLAGLLTLVHGFCRALPRVAKR